MSSSRCCRYCQQVFQPSRYRPQQSVCSEADCQRRRRSDYHRQRIRSDSHYAEDVPPIRLRLKVEINSREHFTIYGTQRVPFTVTSRWFNGSCDIHSYELAELLGTKMRALYQRKKGRDLFDLAMALKKSSVDADRIVAAFSEYMVEKVTAC